MSVTCTKCGRDGWVSDEIREIACECGHRYDPAARPTVEDPFLGKEISGYRFEQVLGANVLGTVVDERSVEDDVLDQRDALGR